MIVSHKGDPIPIKEMKKERSFSIPSQRMALYALFLSLVPLLYAFFLSSKTIQDEKKRCSILQEKQQEIYASLESQRANRAVVALYQKRDPFYLNRTLGHFLPLQKEQKFLENSKNQEFLPDFGRQEKRYSYLKNGENSFIFTESAATIFPLFKETTETQTKSVEIDEEDLQYILHSIEGEDTSLSRPQFILLEAQLNRKKGYNRENWAISCTILKRIFTSTIGSTKDQENKNSSN